MNDMNRRSALMACASSLAALSPNLTFAQTAANFPSRPVRWVVPTSTGAGTDFAARTFAQIASESWKQSLVVENRPGASGMLGLDFVAGAAPDGHTLLFFSVSQFIDATLLQKYTFEANKDFTPISMLATTPLILMAHADAQVSTVQQLIAKAKAQPKALNYSSGGSGGLTHLAMEVFLNRAGIEVLHVPYKGSGPAIIDLLSNVVQLSFSTPPAVMQHVKSGRLKALAVTTPTRDSLLPDVPTFAEAGLPSLGAQTWAALFGPAKLPPEIANRMSAAVRAAIADPASRARIERQGFDLAGSTPAELNTFVAGQLKDWKQAFEDVGLKPE